MGLRQGDAKNGCIAPVKRFAREKQEMYVREGDCMREQMEEHFVSNINEDDSYLEILNWYRNLYHTERADTERGVVARAINGLFMDLRDRKAEDKFHDTLEA